VARRPAVTNGLPYSSGTKRYGRWPITVETWPGPMNPSRRRSGELEDGLDRGHDRHVVREDAEVHDPVCLALSTVAAVEGAVVSNPTAKNTMCRSGLSTATRTHRGASRRPGCPRPALGRQQTPVRARNAHHVAERGENDAGRLGTAMASSMRPIGMTHTGQPGPCTNSTDVGRRCSMRDGRSCGCGPRRPP